MHTTQGCALQSCPKAKAETWALQRQLLRGAADDVRDLKGRGAESEPGSLWHLASFSCQQWSSTMGKGRTSEREQKGLSPSLTFIWFMKMAKNLIQVPLTLAYPLADWKASRAVMSLIQHYCRFGNWDLMQRPVLLWRGIYACAELSINICLLLPQTTGVLSFRLFKTLFPSFFGQTELSLFS